MQKDRQLAQALTEKVNDYLAKGYIRKLSTEELETHLRSTSVISMRVKQAEMKNSDFPLSHYRGQSDGNITSRSVAITT